MKRFFLTLLVLPLLFACGRVDRPLPSSSGKPYELFAVCDADLWKTSVGDTLKAIFGQPMEMLNQPEPLYELYSVSPTNFKTLSSKHRNVLVLAAGDKYPKSDMVAEFDVYAKPQLVITITAPNADSLTAFIGRYQEEIVGMYDIAERERMTAKAAAYPNPSIVKLIQEKFGFSLSIPENYKVRTDAPDFLWVSYELPLASIGFVIYTYPADTTVNNNSAGNILAARNRTVMQIPGPSDGSYMATNLEIMPQQKILTVNGRKWNEVRGFWEVKGDFMGGPFVNYTTYDALQNRMIAIDGYVFSPDPDLSKYGKRNYIHQIEGIFRTVRVD